MTRKQIKTELTRIEKKLDRIEKLIKKRITESKRQGTKVKARTK